MHPIKSLFAMAGLMAAFLVAPARAEAIPCNVITCGGGVCSKSCTHPQTGAPTTCGDYYHWNCTPECVRGQPTHYTYVGTFQEEADTGSPLNCDFFTEWKEHYTDSCGNSFYKCVVFPDHIGFCQPNGPTLPVCTGGI